MKKLLQIFWIFFKVGSFTFGGGLAMLPLIEKEVVDKQKLVEEHEILDIFAISQSVPGVIAVNSAVFIGNKIAGLWGAIAAVLGATLPAFISIIVVLEILMSLTNNIYVGKVFGGIKAASAALILLSAVKLGKSALKARKDYIIAGVSFLIIVVLNISAVWAVILGGTAGYTVYLLNRRKK